MKKILIYLLCCMVGIPLWVAAQSVAVKVAMYPPYPLNYQDLLNRHVDNIIEVQNLSNTTQSVQLGFRVFSYENNVSLQSQPGKRSPKPIIVPPLATVRIGSVQMNDFFSTGNVISSGFSVEEIKAKRAVPEGYYYVCFKAYDYQTLKPLGDESCSNPIAMMALESPKLRLVNPVFNDTLMDVSIQNVMFQWNTPSNIRANLNDGLEYKLKIVEVYPGMNENQAILAAPVFTPEFVVRGGNSFIYGPAKTPFIKGQRYAAILQINDPQNRFNFRNGGRSEVITFVYGRKSASHSFTDHVFGNTMYPTASLPDYEWVVGNVLWAYKATAETEASLKQLLIKNKPSTDREVVKYTRTPSGKDKHPLSGSVVSIISCCDNSIIASGVTDAFGKFKIQLDRKKYDACKQVWLQVQPPNATLATTKTSIVLQPTPIGYQVAEQVVQAQTFQLALLLSDSLKARIASVQVLLTQTAFANYQIDGRMPKETETAVYNNQSYAVVAKMNKDFLHTKILQNINGSDKYLLKIFFNDGSLGYFPMQNVYFPSDKHGQKPEVTIIKKID